MEDLDGPLYAKGLKLLKEDPSWRELFLKMPEKRKKDWILSLISKYAWVSNTIQGRAVPFVLVSWTKTVTYKRRRMVYLSSLRNVIERCFSALKARFLVLKQMPKGFSVKTQKYLPTACCMIHNFIRMHDRNDEVFKFYSKEDLIVESEQHNRSIGSSQQINVTPSQL
ncbi:hypothetical protein Vadar_027351 [Vaccinium darrowii]|uniref:Uncharacterized protein n=1 Tax=Vaccinium darrowii TaxID=229202 RepID=A0ACB7YYM0_9ERIC|nr:hypothetical protein Vadar_027351 [Vaccinium darrowii]